MRRPLSMLLILMMTTVYAQFGPQQIITTEANGPNSIFVTDFDGDNLPDVVSANKFGSSITWYKNLDGTSFGPENFIGFINQPVNVYAANLDGDSDMDVLSLSAPDDLIVWYENLDGLGDFSNQKIISDTEDGIYEIIASDLDGDSDLDVISGSASLGLSWFENLDGLGNFGPKQIINASASAPRSVAAVDIDGDLDLDIVSSSSGSVTLTWYENLDGLGNFGAMQVIAPSAPAINSIFAIDLDMDNDVDILTSTVGDNKMAWFENLDGQGNFSNEIVITTQAAGINTVFAADLDNDNDIDAISSTFDDGVSWYENLNGEGVFGTEQIITINILGLKSIFAADIDNDTDIDVFSASQNDDKIAWYENQTIVGIEEYNNIEVILTPNPVKDLLNISAKENISAVALSNVLGQELYNSNVEALETTLDLSNYANGTYFVTIVIEGNSITKKVIKE